MGNYMELKAMGQDEIYYRRRGSRAKMWVLQHLENNQRRRHCLGDGEGMAWGHPETQSVVQQQPGEVVFQRRVLLNTAERWTSTKTDERSLGLASWMPLVTKQLPSVWGTEGWGNWVQREWKGMRWRLWPIWCEGTQRNGDSSWKEARNL